MLILKLPVIDSREEEIVYQTKKDHLVKKVSNIHLHIKTVLSNINQVNHLTKIEFQF